MDPAGSRSGARFRDTWAPARAPSAPSDAQRAWRAMGCTGPGTERETPEEPSPQGPGKRKRYGRMSSSSITRSARLSLPMWMIGERSNRAQVPAYVPAAVNVLIWTWWPSSTGSGNRSW
jgi:hypothetical protein